MLIPVIPEIQQCKAGWNGCHIPKNCCVKQWCALLINTVSTILPNFNCMNCLVLRPSENEHHQYAVLS